MKTQATFWVLAAVSTLALSARAQGDYIVNTFDTADEAAGWARWWGAATQVYEYDATVDAAGSATSGSLKATIGFNQPAYTGDNQFAVIRGFPVTNASVFTNLVFDLRWDRSSPQRPYNDHGYLECGFRVNGFNQSWFPGGTAIPTNGDWIHFELPIRPTMANLDTVSGIVLKMWAGGAGDGLTGTATFWLDNVKLIAKQGGEPPPPPTLTMSKPATGLNLLASHPTEQYQRQSIRSVSTAVSWIDQFDPVSYSITIAKYPDGAHNNFQAHMFLAPVANSTANDSYADYNAPNVIFWQIANNANGSAYSRFMFKTNQPSGNSQLFGAGTLAIIGNASPLGRWTLTFNGNTDVSITTPSGSVTNFVMPVEAVELFKDNTQANALNAWFGAQPNSPGNIGQQAIFSRIQVTREFDSIDDNFTGPGLDASRWAVVALNPAGVVAVPPDAIGWLKWTLPDIGFVLQSTADLGDASSWAAANLAAPQIIDYKRVLLTPANVTTANGFFRMRKP